MLRAKVTVQQESRQCLGVSLLLVQHCGLQRKHSCLRTGCQRIRPGLQARNSSSPVHKATFWLLQAPWPGGGHAYVHSDSEPPLRPGTAHSDGNHPCNYITRSFPEPTKVALAKAVRKFSSFVHYFSPSHGFTLSGEALPMAEAGKWSLWLTAKVSCNATFLLSPSAG